MGLPFSMEGIYYISYRYKAVIVKKVKNITQRLISRLLPYYRDILPLLLVLAFFDVTMSIMSNCASSEANTSIALLPRFFQL